MTVPRASHTATLLLNGKVLITGGYSATAFDAPIASAELYDPSTGAFSATGNMTTARRGHSATLLPDGRVLIAGGSSESPGSIELYDPAAGTFTASSEVLPGEGSIRSVLLGNGKVFILNQSSVGLYDPSSGKFDAYCCGYSFNVDTATLLADGSVLINGCAFFCNVPIAVLYDPRGNGAFVPAGPMSGSGSGHTATLLMNGQVLFVGYEENDGLPSAAEAFQLATRTFTRLANTIGPHQLSTATLMADGMVLVAGGQLPGGNGDAGGELFDPAADSFASGGKMITGRHLHTATLLPDGSVLLAGGFNLWPQPTANAEIYKPFVLQRAPQLYTLSGEEGGQGAILHAGTDKVVSPENPAHAGDVLEIYCAGLADDSVIPPQIAIGGRMAEVLYFGKAPGFASLNQVNVRMPEGVASGDAVSVRLNYISRPSNEVTIGAQ
jgi:hypothetical protein